MRGRYISNIQEITLKKIKIKKNENLLIRHVHWTNMLVNCDMHILQSRLLNYGLEANIGTVQIFYNKSTNKEQFLTNLTYTLRMRPEYDEYDYGLTVDVKGDVYWSPGCPAPIPSPSL